MLKPLFFRAAVVLLFLQFAGCTFFSGKSVEGRLDMEVGLRGFSLERGLVFDNRNFIIHDGVAYELVFLSSTRLKNFSASGEGVSVPVPAELGVVKLEPGALYRISGASEPTGKRYRNLPVEMMLLRSIEYLGPGGGGLKILY